MVYTSKLISQFFFQTDLSTEGMAVAHNIAMELSRKILHFSVECSHLRACAECSDDKFGTTDVILPKLLVIYCSFTSSQK